MKGNYILTMLVLLVYYSDNVMAQKKLIDNEAYKTWVALGRYNVSNDGKYAWYNYGSRLVVCTTNGKYKREFPFGRNASFTADSKHLIFDSSKGLAILQIAEDSIQYIEHGGEFSKPEGDDSRWLSYHKESDIILKDRASGKEISYPNATGAWFNAQGTTFVVQTTTALLWLSLPDEKPKAIAHGKPTSEIAFDATGTRIAFITPGLKGNTLHYYGPGLDSAAQYATDSNPGIGKGFTIADEVPQFDQYGHYVFFKLRVDNAASAVLSNNAQITNKVETWHYNDKYLLSEQQQTLLPELSYHTYTAIALIHTGKVMRLESVDTALSWPNNKPGCKYVLASNIVNTEEFYWNKETVSYELVSLLNGNHKKILSLSYPHTAIACELSPAEQFVTWYDQKEKNYFCYEIATGITRNITQVIQVPMYNNDGAMHTYGLPFRIAGWLADDNALLIYDEYDIWKVDPLNRKLPVNVTAGYGRLHKIIFRIAGDQFRPITADTLLFSALNTANKYNGFWKKSISSAAAPISCGKMSPSLYYFPGIGDGSIKPPIKAKNAQVYLVQCMSSSDSPNLFATTDLHSFIPLSDIQPQKQYNWMTTELIRWKMPDGRLGEGILYKPENFDPGKRYPLIFHYYEQFSKEMFLFKKPDLISGRLSIPWYVSNGYLVFVPNIYYTPRHTSQSVVNSVVSAAKYLSKFPWVDARKLGLQGHSFGGYETNCLITRSGLFAAAQESAGMSDMVSWYGGLSFGGKCTAFKCEDASTDRLGTPWERPGIYAENSPVFGVDKVKTPLLIQHNKMDDAVPFAQALEMFTALRRLKKPAWLIQYDGETHTLTDQACRLDFSIRQQQFFNHYLKGEPAPAWMIEGIGAKVNDVKTGLMLGK